MLEQLQNADSLMQGIFVAVSGLIGVFIILILFFITIKVIERIGKKMKQSNDNPKAESDKG